MASKQFPPWLPIVGVGALGGVLLFMVSKKPKSDETAQVVFTPDYTNYPLLPTYGAPTPTPTTPPEDGHPSTPITLPVIITPSPVGVKPSPPYVPPSTPPSVGGVIKISPFIARDSPAFTSFSPRYARIYPKVFLSRLGINAKHD
jgi:hypothetical protein